MKFSLLLSALYTFLDKIKMFDITLLNKLLPFLFMYMLGAVIEANLTMYYTKFIKVIYIFKKVLQAIYIYY